jgi:hypothetical protein
MPVPDQVVDDHCIKDSQSRTEESKKQGISADDESNQYANSKSEMAPGHVGQ